MTDILPESFYDLAYRLGGVKLIDDFHVRAILRDHAIMVRTVRPMGSDWFEISEDGTGTVACVAFDGELPGQGICWLPDRPERVRWVDPGGKSFVGYWHLRDRATMRRPAVLVGDAESWVRAASDAIWILDWRGFDPHCELADFRTVQCATPALAERLVAACKPRFKITVKADQEDIRHAA